MSVTRAAESPNLKGVWVLSSSHYHSRLGRIWNSEVFNFGSNGSYQIDQYAMYENTSPVLTYKRSETGTYKILGNQIQMAQTTATCPGEPTHADIMNIVTANNYATALLKWGCSEAGCFEIDLSNTDQSQVRVTSRMLVDETCNNFK